jgi:hypothetical protein
MTMALQEDLWEHLLTDTVARGVDPQSPYCGKARSHACFLCELLGREETGAVMKNTTLGCYKCGVHLHLQCFNKFHHWHFNLDSFNSAMDSALQSKKAKAKCSSSDAHFRSNWLVRCFESKGFALLTFSR